MYANCKKFAIKTCDLFKSDTDKKDKDGDIDQKEDSLKTKEESKDKSLFDHRGSV